MAQEGQTEGAGPRVSRCPFASMLGNPGSSMPSASPTPSSCPISGAAAAPSSGGASCPFKAAAAAATAAAGAAPVQAAEPAAAPAPGSVPASAADSQPATCPYGFGGPQTGPRMSVLHCTLCRSLLFEPAKADGCQHIFCCECLSKFRDCPVCGADIPGISHDPDSQRERLRV